MLIDFIVKNKVKIFIITGLLAAAVIVWLVYFYIISLSIISISPNLNRFSYLSPYLDINFNKTIAEDDLSIDDPNQMIDSTTISGKTLRLNFIKPFNYDQEYSFILNNVKSSEDSSILMNHIIKFKPVNDDSFISNEQLDIILEKQEDKPDLSIDPIVEVTPYSADELYIDAVEKIYMDNHDGTGEYKVVEIKVNMFPNKQSLESNYNKTVNTLKAKANSYIESILKKPISSLDEAKYKIIYVVQ